MQEREDEETIELDPISVPIEPALTKTEIKAKLDTACNEMFGVKARAVDTVPAVPTKKVKKVAKTENVPPPIASLTALDAVYQVLIDVKQREYGKTVAGWCCLTTREITAIALGRGLWQTNNKTPLAGIAWSIRCAIAKGDQRFVEVERGLFAVS